MGEFVAAWTNSETKEVCLALGLGFISNERGPFAYLVKLLF